MCSLANADVNIHTNLAPPKSVTLKIDVDDDKASKLLQQEMEGNPQAVM